MPNDEPKITVSHADLDAALEAAKVPAAEPEPPAIEPEPKTPEPEPAKAISSDPDQDVEPEPEPDPDAESEEPDEPDDNKERSRLGRRVSGIEQSIERLAGLIEKVVTAKAEPEPEDPDDDEPVFMTKKQLREFVRNQAKDEVRQTKAEEQATQSKYENAYVSHVRKVGANLPPKQLDAIFKEMFDNHNSVIHKIPEVDADINFHRAVASLAAKAKPAAKVVPLKKDDPKNLGGPADTNKETKTAKSVPKLDEHAAAFAKYHKLSDEQITNALSGETRLSLRGKL